MRITDRAVPLAIAAVEIAGFVGFLGLSRVGVEAPISYVPFIAAAGGVPLLVASGASRPNIMQVVTRSLSVSAIVTLSFMALGLVLPGLRKDLEWLSHEGLLRLLAVFGLAFAINGVAFTSGDLLRPRAFSHVPRGGAWVMPAWPVALVVVSLLSLAVFGGSWLKVQVRIDSCLDRGGRWDEVRSLCMGARE